MMHNNFLSPFWWFDMLVPRVCVSCNKEWSYLCSDCKQSLHPHPEICPLTHAKSPWYATRQDILVQESPLDGCIVLFRFDPLIRTLIRRLKYYHRHDIAEFLAQRLSLAFQSHSLFQQKSAPCIVTGVPSHRWRRYMVKWYNQSVLLAQHLVKSFLVSNPERLVHYQALVGKSRHTRSQVGLNREQRKHNLRDAFILQNDIPDGAIVIIVDDVVTTGSTLVEIAKTIKKSQPYCQVRWLCVARNG